MKNAYIHDGSGWQSLKGPPGPSEPSKDAGNNLTVGSDGLLMLKGDTQFSGVWTPIFSSSRAIEGYWTRAGRAVTLTIQFEADVRSDGDPMITYGIGGLPFSVSEFYDPDPAAGSTLFATFAAPVVSANESGVIGTAVVTGVNPDTIGVAITEATPEGIACITLTYLTDDARIG